MSELFIGLMSGTSLDGVDAALVDFSKTKPQLLETLYFPFPSVLRKDILSLCSPGDNEIHRLGLLDVQLGHIFADTVNGLLKKAAIPPQKVLAIGSHGQTIRHHPDQRFTLQIGDPNIIAAETGITTIADFRRRDIALGGQGAPLVPAFHQSILSHPVVDRAIVNIGGIANVTLLPANSSQLVGFDTGPGNTLLDAWIQKHLNLSHDEQGAWGAQGEVNIDLLTHLLGDSYFMKPAPKSTGREYFNLSWLARYVSQDVSAVDVQATLTALTAHSIVNAVQTYQPNSELWICGGGAQNAFLMTQLGLLSQSVGSTLELGIDPNWMEAMAFAWLAKQTFTKNTGNMTSVTGAKQAAILGGVYY